MNLYEPPRPGDLEEVKIEVTHDCPLACVHCSSDAGETTGVSLAPNTVFSLIKQAANMDVKSIALSGGEPLLWPWLSDAVNLCRTCGLTSTVYSTGISELDGGAKILDLAKLGLTRVIFSLYSPRRHYHELVTTKAGSFNRTIEAIQLTRNSGLRRELHFVPFRRTYRQIEEMVSLAASNGIDTISVLRFVPQGRGVVLQDSMEVLRHRETVELRNLLADCRRSHAPSIRVGSPYNILMLEGKVECNAARKTLIVDPRGNLYPCDAFKSIEPSALGIEDEFHNISGHTLDDCWQRSSYLNAIRKYLSTPFEEPCSSCTHLDLCKSGCLAQKVLAQRMIVDGKIAKRPDPLCLKQYIGGFRACN